MDLSSSERAILPGRKIVIGIDHILMDYTFFCHFIKDGGNPKVYSLKKGAEAFLSHLLK